MPKNFNYYQKDNMYGKYGQEEDNSMGMITYTKSLEPKVYSLQVLDKVAKENLSKNLEEENKDMVIPDVYLKFKSNRVELPAKIYGKVNRLLNHYMTRFDSNNESLEVLLVGDAGSGKSLLSDMICQECLNRGYPVIDVSGLDLYDVDYVSFFKSLSNVCIRLDEFGKMIGKYSQDLLLTIMTERDRRIFWILTENSYDNLNRFIIGSTHRVRYSQEFSKIDPEVIEGYCKDNNISPNFVKQLLVLQNKAKHFSFTHLKTLVEEHKLFPDMSLDKIVSLLNLKHLTTIYNIVLKRFCICGIEVLELPKRDGIDFKFYSTRLKQNTDGQYGDFKKLTTKSTEGINKKDDNNLILKAGFEEINELLKDIYPFTLEVALPIIGDNRKILSKSNSSFSMDNGTPDPIKEQIIAIFKQEYEGNPSLLSLREENYLTYKDITTVNTDKENPLLFKNAYIEAEIVITSEDLSEEFDVEYFMNQNNETTSF